jgi:KEOPS complex subunit Pcc1
MDKPDLPVSAIVSILMDPGLLDAVKTALIPEAESPSSERSRTEVSIRGNELVIETFASDTTALRASLNSYLRWVQGIQGIVDIL